MLRSIITFGPIAGGTVAYGIYRLFYIQAKIYGTDVAPLAANMRLDDQSVLSSVPAILGRLGWGVTGAFFVLAFLGAFAVLSGLILKDVQDLPKHIRYRVLGATLFFAAAVGWASAGDNPFVVQGFGPVLIQTFAALEMHGARILLTLFTPMVLAVTVLLMAASSTVLAGGTIAGDEAALRLRNRFRHLHTALFVGAAMLVAGIVHASVMHRLPLVLMDEAGAADWGRLIEGMSASMGAVWTLILLGIYLPALWVLRRRARGLALESADGKSSKHIDEWLSTHGLTAQFPQKLAHVAALLGPLIIGGPAAPLLQLLTG